MLENNIAEPEEDWQKIKFTWPASLSLSYMLEEYEVGEDGKIIVKKLTFSPRFMTEKGALEDIAGQRLKRETAV